jgi:hypothetical protein
MCKKTGENVLLYRLNLAAQTGKRLATNKAQYFRIAPFAMEAARTETTFEDPAFVRKLAERFSNRRSVERKAFGSLAESEGAMGAGIAADQLKDRMRDRFKQGCSKPRR